ncbi:MAG: hypothetical protein M0Z41_01840 [Peptococcaceae bacterium]|jgi:hypothetical protein|nr:hypothetical protein [Peptococcaceae bacterium]
MAKRRQRKPKSDEEKLLNNMRKKFSVHVVEIELMVLAQQGWLMQRIGEHLRIIRNTVLGQLKKNYDQMVRTKAYKRIIRKYSQVCQLIDKAEKDKDQAALEIHAAQKKELDDKLQELRNRHNVTFEYARKYGEELRKKFSLPDAVTVLTVCEMAWHSIEGLLFRNANNVYFYNRDNMITFQGKQAERCIILKRDPINGRFHVSFNGMDFPLIVKQDDLYVQETLAHIANYLDHGLEMDRQNIELFKLGLPLISTYRICNNRIVRREIRGKIRYYLQIVLEGKPVPRRKKDGTIRHAYGQGRIGGDIGTQSLAIVGRDIVTLKNLAERSPDTFAYERKIHRWQRYMDRSRRATNPDNYNPDGTFRKGGKVWVYSKRYKKARAKVREMHRKAADSRKYAHNEEVNRLRAIADQLVIETMDIQALQKRAGEATVNPRTSRFNRRKRFGKSIGKRSPGYFIKQGKYRFDSSGGCVKEVNTWKFKASQYDHILHDTNKKQLSMRWHELPDGTRVQRDLYSAFLLYCSDDDLQKPDKDKCDSSFGEFLKLHGACIDEIKASGKVVMNSGIKFGIKKKRTKIS